MQEPGAPIERQPHCAELRQFGSCDICAPTDIDANRTQRFFEVLQAETRRPSFGDRDRDFIRNLLLRAQEAGIFSPPPEHQ